MRGRLGDLPWVCVRRGRVRWTKALDDRASRWSYGTARGIRMTTIQGKHRDRSSIRPRRFYRNFVRTRSDNDKELEFTPPSADVGMPI
jgi:hypothetical protein